jgi:glucose/mannose-6-phosphate isomerase
MEHVEMFSNLPEEMSKAVELLQKLRGEWVSSKPARGNPVKQLAKKLVGKVPFILACRATTEAAGLRLKTQFNENSKTTAFFNVFPEMNHNEIVSLSSGKRGEHNFSLILLRDEGDNERNKKRMEITKSLIGNQVGGASEISSQGKTALSRLLSLIYFGDLLSVYLAVLKGVDPTPVEVIARLKKELLR